ncbi:hypothetical protein KAR48_02370 [bacterium]|nr:hypothetical protein [bacterium]
MRTRLTSSKINKKTGRSRRRWPWFILLTILLVPLLATLWLAWLAPAETTADWLAETISNTVDFPVELGRVRVNVWGGLDIEDLTVFYPESGNSDRARDSLLVIDKVTVRYRLLPLLRRQFEVAAISLERPRAFIDPVKLAALTSVETEARASGIAQSDSIILMPMMPVDLNLNNFSIEDMVLEIVLPDTLPLHSIELSSFSFSIDDLSIPREGLTNPEKACGRLKLLVEKGQLTLGWPETEQVVPLSLDWSAHWEKGGAWTIVGDLALDQWVLNLDAAGEGPGDSALLHKASLKLNESEIIEMTGSYQKDARLSLKLDSSPVVLQHIIDSARRLAGPFLPPDSLIPELYGSIRPISGELSGNFDAISFSLYSNLENFSMVLPDSIIDISPINAVVHAEGVLNKDGLEKGTITAEALLPSLVLAISDSTSLEFGALTCNIHSTLDSLFMPDSASLSLRCQDVLKGSMLLEAEWQRGSSLEWQQMAAQIKVSADSTLLDALPMLPSPITGNLGMKLGIVLTPGGNIDLNLNANVDSLSYIFQEQTVYAPPIILKGLARARWPDFESPFELDSLLLDAVDGIHARFSGQFVPESASFNGRLEELSIDNQVMWSYLPAPLQEQLTGLKINGYESLIANMQGSQVEDSTLLDLGGLANVGPVSIDWPENDLSIQSVGAELGFKSDRTGYSGTFQVDVVNTCIRTLRDAPFGHIDLSAGWSFKNMDSLLIHSGRLASTFGLSGSFDLTLAGLIAGIPQLQTEIRIGFHSQKYLPLVQQISMAGDLDLHASVVFDLQPGGCVDLRGKILVDSLYFKIDTLISAGPVYADLPFNMSFNPDLMRFNIEQMQERLDTDDYALHQESYRKHMPGIGWLRIDSITVMDQKIGPVEVDTRITGGQFEIPWMNIRGLSGNIGASLYVIAQGGVLDSLAYGFSMDVARINSAALLRSGNKYKAASELNATTRFTGKGVDFKRDVDINGYFHITKIGPEFASTLLSGMDPKGRDRNIRLTRRLLNMGWKPRLFSFEMRHGYVYPSLVLDQPWFSPIRLPEQMGLGRLPVAFFIQNINMYSQ